MRLNSESSTAVNNIFSKSARKMDTQILKRTIRGRRGRLKELELELTIFYLVVFI